MFGGEWLEGEWLGDQVGVGMEGVGGTVGEVNG